MGTERNGIVKTTDGGATWTRHRQGLRWSPGIGYPEFYDIAISPSDPQIVFAATVDSPGPITGDYPSTIAGIYKSVNGGEPWVRRNCGLTNSRVISIQFDPEDSLVAIVGIGAGERSFSSGQSDSLPLFFERYPQKVVNSQAVYPLSEQHGLKARERIYTPMRKESTGE